MWSARLHFVNVADGTCSYNRSRDCPTYTPASKAFTQPLACLDGAVLNYTTQLATQRYLGRPLTAARLNEAVKFLVHLVGDLHQPLHCGWAGDSGGNGFLGTFINANNVNLHEVWDANIIARRDNDFGGRTGYLSWLIKQVNASNPQAIYRNNLTSWTTCKDTSAVAGACSDEWTAESVELACAYAYKDASGATIKDGFNLQLPYYNRAYPIIDDELARCGVRLASILNRLYSSIPAPLPPSPGPVQVIFLMKYDLAALPFNFSARLVEEVNNAAKVAEQGRVGFESVVSVAAGSTVLVTLTVQESSLPPPVPADTPNAAALAGSIVLLFNNPDSDLYFSAVAAQSVPGSASTQAYSPSNGGGGGNGGSSTSANPLTNVLIGVIIAGVLLLAILIIVLYCCYVQKERQSKGQQQRMSSEYGGGGGGSGGGNSNQSPRSAPSSDLEFAEVAPNNNPFVAAVQTKITHAHAAPAAAAAASYAPPTIPTRPMIMHAPASSPPPSSTVAMHAAPPPPPSQRPPPPPMPRH